MSSVLGILKESIFPKQILGLNSRNLDYVASIPAQPFLAITKNKLKTKKILTGAGLPTPKNYFVIKSLHQLVSFDFSILPKTFVLKPNLGLGGQGIIIVYGRKKDSPIWIKAGQKKIGIGELSSHVFNILEGYFSGGKSDIAFFEERVKLEPTFKHFTYKGGVPDIRIIVYNKIPVMAMLRIPTEKSQGKANLSLGAVGVGIELASGLTTFGLSENKEIEYFPKTRIVVKGIKVPFFKQVLKLASESAEILGLSFCGVDITLDRERGPVILEVNDRPGLTIQLVNKSPLKERLLRIANLEVKSSQRAIKIAQELFGQGEVEIDEVAGKKIINHTEDIEIVLANGELLKTKALIDTGSYRSQIDQTLFKSLNLNHTAPKKTVRVRSALGTKEFNVVSLNFVLKNRLINSDLTLADRSQLKYPFLVGRRDLKDFLIKPD